MQETIEARLNVAEAISLAFGLFIDGHYAEAEPLFRTAEQHGGGFPALNGLGMCLNELERPQEALLCFDHAYALLRDEMFALIANRGKALAEAGKSDEAIAVFDGLLKNSSNEQVRNYRAIVQTNKGDIDESSREFEALSTNNPANDQFKYNRALVHLQQGKAQECIDACDDLLTRDQPNPHLVHFARGFAHLMLGNYEKGFADYEHRRLDNVDPPWTEFKGNLCEAPTWNGEDISDKTILVHADQGLGDNIMFSRYLPLMVKKAKRVIVALPKGQQIITNSVPGTEYVSGAESIVAEKFSGGPKVIIEKSEYDTGQYKEGRGAWPMVDCWIRFMSLAFAFKTTRENIPPPITLKVDDANLKRWQERIGNGGNLKVGLCWAGAFKSRYDKHRTIALEKLEPLFDLPNITFYSLQKELRDGDAELIEKHGIIDLGPELKTFEETACAMKCLDLMVTVDTSVAHLAGTVGLPTLVMLTKFRTYWLWLSGENMSPWYPSIEVFQQQTDGNWDNVVAGVVQKISLNLQRSLHDVD